MKLCTCCSIFKDETCFRKHRTTCKYCNVELQNIRRRKNPEKYNIKARISYIKNSKKIKSNNKRYYAENPQKFLARVKKRSQIKRKQINAYDRQYAKNNPDKRTAIYAKRRAAKLNRIPNWLTKSDWIEIRWDYSYAKQLRKETGLEHEVDHIIPLKGKTISGLHCPQNLQILTAKENNFKKNKFPYKRSA